MADLWQGLCTLTAASLADCEAAQLKLVAGLATSEALQVAMPVVRDQYIRQAFVEVATVLQWTMHCPSLSAESEPLLAWSFCVSDVQHLLMFNTFRVLGWLDMQCPLEGCRANANQI